MGTLPLQFGNLGLLFVANLRHGYLSGGESSPLIVVAKRGLPHNEKCMFYNFAEENAQHLFIRCSVVYYLEQPALVGSVSTQYSYH
jgi:hypothetical protein